MERDVDKRIVTQGRRSLVPACSVIADESSVVVKLEMPGVGREGLEIRVEGNALTIDGRRGDDEPRGNWLLKERRRMDYRKAFTLDDTIDRDGISAECKDGILTLTMKVKEAAKPRRIAIS